MSKFVSKIPKDRKIYGNCQVLSPDNILMFKCNEKKANWYLHRNLAEITNQDPLIIKLNFKPKGLGNFNNPYGLSVMVNRCVNCGTEDYLTKHHVVPACYRKNFPLHLKSHNFHDVLTMCVDCHESYERHADQLKLYLAKKYNSPIEGIIIENKDLDKANSNASVLLKDTSGIPTERLNKIKFELLQYFGREFTKEDLITISKSKQHVEKTHGCLVMEKITDIQDFVEMWRKHFVENNQCNFMPDNWDVKNKKSNY